MAAFLTRQFLDLRQYGRRSPFLLRATTRQDYYESALRELGIQFTTGGKGRGFFFRQEVRDVSGLLTWLASEHDRLALLGVMRSPFIGFSDSAIAILSSCRVEPAADDAAASLRHLSGQELTSLMMSRGVLADRVVERLTASGLAEDVECYRNGRDLLVALKALAGRVSAVDLVREAIRLTGYDAVLAGGFHGTQSLANLQKLLSILNSTERSNTMLLSEIAEWLRDQIGEVKAPDAVVSDPDDDAVRISTAHSSKGLTSRVIFIPDLRYCGVNDQSRCFPFDVEGDVRVAGSLEQPGPDGERRSLTTYEFDEVKAAAAVGRQEETQRLFYVAITRARSLVVLSGETPAGVGASWRSWVNEWMSDLVARDPAELDRLVRLRGYDEVRESSASLEATRPRSGDGVSSRLLAAATAPFSGGASVSDWRLPVTSLVRIPAADDTERLLAYRRSSLVGLAPAHYRSRTEEHAEDAPEGADQEPGTSRRAADLGTLAHDALERYDYSLEASVGVPRVLRQLGADESMVEALTPRVSAVVEHLSNDLRGNTDVLRELPFVATFSHEGERCTVDGKIDLMYLKDSVWHIVDYKFTESGEEGLRDDYAMQLQIYHSAVSRESAGLREPLFCEGAPTSFQLWLFGCNAEGRFLPIAIQPLLDDEVSSRLVVAAKIIAEQSA